MLIVPTPSIVYLVSFQLNAPSTQVAKSQSSVCAFSHPITKPKYNSKTPVSLPRELQPIVRFSYAPWFPAPMFRQKPKVTSSSSVTSSTTRICTRHCCSQISCCHSWIPDRRCHKLGHCTPVWQSSTAHPRAASLASLTGRP